MANIEKMLEEIEKMTVIELADLVKAIEEKFKLEAILKILEKKKKIRDG